MRRWRRLSGKQTRNTKILLYQLAPLATDHDSLRVFVVVRLRFLAIRCPIERVISFALHKEN